VPAFHTGGWYDIFLRGTLRNYAGLEAHGGSEGARKGQRLLVGPWLHGYFGRKTGDVDFGPEADKGDWIDQEGWRWFDHVLRGAPDDDKPVRLFVMGRNVWRDEDDWPLARARSTRFALHSKGHANGRDGDGTLSTTAPGDEPSDSFVFDPAKPVPTRGGGLCCDGDHLAAGAFDQRDVEARSDVLVYSSDALADELEVTGPITVDLIVLVAFTNEAPRSGPPRGNARVGDRLADRTALRRFQV
jgi:putative CocE/NonD family hydrolase